MRIFLVWEWEALIELIDVVTKAIAALGLIESIEIQTWNDPAYKMELWITENPALCIEEESINFKDVIFQWQIPEYEEISSMFISILGDDDHNEWSSCWSGGCGDCWSGGCH